ncbi:MAG TPA: pseudouridine synthase [Clostridiales bacterium]|nr:pseudouridine synthase [Clostridiales bacterium]
MRINKFLASCGIASRRKVEEYILDGRITVNGQVTTNLSTDILESDVVLFDGKPVKNREEFEYYMLNKPVGYISSAQDDRNRKTVVSLIKTNARIYPVGRLDFNSEGLLLLTNDGELTNKLTHPKHNIGKTYIVKINSSITDREVNLVRNGVTIDGYKLHPCKIKVLDGSENYTRFEITIFEGRNREIRKMFEVIKKQVVYLKRIKIENLKLGNLKTGEYRKLSKAEIEYLKNL